MKTGNSRGIRREFRGNSDSKKGIQIKCIKKVIEIIEDESANQHIDKLSRRYTSHPYAREDDVSWDEAGIKDRELWVIEVSKLNSMIRPQAKSDPE